MRVDFFLAQTERIVLFRQIFFVFLLIRFRSDPDDILERGDQLGIIHRCLLSADCPEFESSGRFHNYVVSHIHPVLSG